MKTINKSYKNKVHEYERYRKSKCDESEPNKYTNTSNTVKINQQQQAWGIDKYASAYSR